MRRTPCAWCLQCCASCVLKLVCCVSCALLRRVVVCYGVVSSWCRAAFSCVCVVVLPDPRVGVLMFRRDGATVSWSAGEKVLCRCGLWERVYRFLM